MRSGQYSPFKRDPTKLITSVSITVKSHGFSNYEMELNPTSPVQIMIRNLDLILILLFPLIFSLLFAPNPNSNLTVTKKTPQNNNNNMEQIPETGDLFDIKSWSKAPKLRAAMDAVGFFTPEEDWTAAQKKANYDLEHDRETAKAFVQVWVDSGTVEASDIRWQDLPPGPTLDKMRKREAELYPDGIDPAVYEKARQDLYDSIMKNTKSDGLKDKLDGRTRAALNFSMGFTKGGLGPIGLLVGPLLGGALTGPLLGMLELFHYTYTSLLHLLQ